MKSQEEQWLLQEKYHGEKTAAFFADCKRLALGEPLAYLIGFTPFLDCKIWLDSKPLIPRPETEHWASEAIKTIRNSETISLGLTPKSVSVLDLCAGSGCLGVAVAKAIPEASVDFGEIDARHLSTIAKNLAENNIDSRRCHLYHANLFTTLTTTYDFILSNPPYIDESLNRTEPAVKQHEPYVALFGGEAGLEIITTLIATAPKHLRRGGQLWIEHEPEQSGAIKDLATAHHFSTTTHTDQYGIERYSILVLQ